jgi:hypothetical protein
MKEHPILFNGAMIRAILSGQKTQTRRPVTASTAIVNGEARVRPDVFARYGLGAARVDPGPSPAGNSGPYLRARSAHPGDDGAMVRLYAPWSVGDVLWVREKWRAEELPTGEDGVRFAADRAFVRIADTPEAADLWCEARADGTRWRPSIHMPRWAARLFLRVTAIRCERIQDITEGDAAAEGTREPSVVQMIGGGDVTERRVFARLWSATYGASSWERNEWVWALTFERCADPSTDAGKVAP